MSVSGRSKPAHWGRNHCAMTPFATTAGVENQQVIVTGVDTLTNRVNEVPAGAILKKFRVSLWANDATPVTGRHECFMFFQPAATTFATPLASYRSATHPLPEEAVQMRQNAMGGLHTQFTITGASRAPQWVCKWRSRKGRYIATGDDVVIVLLDANATNWTGYCDYSWVI